MYIHDIYDFGSYFRPATDSEYTEYIALKFKLQTISIMFQLPYKKRVQITKLTKTILKNI